MESTSAFNLQEIKNRFFPERTKNIYQLPFPQDTHLDGIETEGPSHKGPFRGAVDFIVPLGTKILAPLDGEVIEVVDGNSRFGDTDEFVDDLNYITIKHPNGEYSQPAHLEKGSAKVKVGDRVVAGQELGVTGNSGWMDKPHLHLLVFRLDSSNSKGFKGLKIRFNK